MKKLLVIASRKNSLTKPISLIVFTALALAFWISASSSGLAQDPQCTVCHKRVTTLTFSCSSLDLARHLDHGDPMTACAVTPTENP